MHRTKILSVFILAALIPLIGVLRLGHTGVTDNIALGSCSSLSIGGAATGSSESGDSGTADFSTGEPIDIPVSIAKGVEPVDATQFEITLGSGSQLKKKLFKQANTPLTITGKAQQSQVTVVAYVNGDAIAEMNVGDDRVFTLTTTTAIYDTPIAFVVRGLGGVVSYPVVVTLSAPTDLFDFVLSTLHITNITGIVPRVPAVTTDDVAYVALDIDDNPLLAFSPIDGGYPELFSDDPSGTLNYIHYSSEGDFLVGINPEGSLFHVSAADGTSQTAGTTNVTNADFRISPDDQFVVTHYNNGTSYAVKLIDLNDFSNDTVLLASTDTADNTSVYFDWITEDLLLVLKNRADGSQITDIYNLDSILDQTWAETTTLTPTTVRTSSSLALSSPRTDPYTQAIYVAPCTSGGQTGLCLDDFSSAAAVVDTSDSLLDVRNPTWTANGEIIVFDALPASDTSSRVLAAYILDQDETVLLGYGFGPKASPVDANIILYESYDVTGEIQVGLINLAKHPKTSALFE